MKHDFSLSGSPSSPHLVVSGFSIVPRRCTRTARYRGRKNQQPASAHIVLKRARNLPVHFHPLGCRCWLSLITPSPCAHIHIRRRRRRCKTFAYTYNFFSRYFSALTHRACTYICSYMRALCFTRVHYAPMLKWDFSLSRFVLSKLNCAIDMCTVRWMYVDEKKNWRATHAWMWETQTRNKYIYYILFHSTCEVDSKPAFILSILFSDLCATRQLLFSCSFRIEASAAFFTHLEETRPSLFACLQGCDCDYFSVRFEAGCENFAMTIGRFCLICVSDRVFVLV